MTVRTRYAPSPTGEPHLGNIRTALFAWLLAKHHGGQFLLRIEDTDRQRLVEGGVEAQMETLRWLGIDWDEGPDKGGPHAPYTQSERLDIYQEHAGRLLTSDRAYRCYCSSERLAEVRKAQQARKEPPRYDRLCRDLSADDRARREADGAPAVVRFKTPLSGETLTHDALRGEVSFANDTLDDFVIVKSDGYPTYHPAAIVDDHLMQVTHVIRGEEWLSSTPKHILLYQFLGWTPPTMAHLPLILSPTGGKLSKRNAEKIGIPVSVRQYREAGYEPEALLNFLAFLGWNPGAEQEIFTLEGLVEAFSIDRVGSAGVQFNLDKLRWFNQQHLRRLSLDELLAAG